MQADEYDDDGMPALPKGSSRDSETSKEEQQSRNIRDPLILDTSKIQGLRTQRRSFGYKIGKIAKCGTRQRGGFFTKCGTVPCSIGKMRYLGVTLHNAVPYTGCKMRYPRLKSECSSDR